MKNKKIIAIILSTIISHNLLNSISVIATENVEEKAYLELKNNNEFIEEDENLTEKDKENDKLFEESKNPIEKDEENDKLPEEGETLISNEKDSNILGNKDNSKNDIKIGNEEKILETITNLERPFENTNSTGEIYLKGFVLSDEKVNRIEVLVNNKKIGNASINLKRDDIFNKYPEYNNRNSGYEYQVKELVNGSNIIATRVYLEDGTYYTRSTIVNVNREQKTNINGTANLMRDKMIQILLNNNKEKTYEYAKNFVDITIKESNAENIRYDVAFAQMMHETNFLKFGGDVKEEQNNFAGLGATGGGVQGHSFESVEIGIRAVIQHLKAYSSTEKLKNECVDPRFNYVKRGSIPS